MDLRNFCTGAYPFFSAFFKAHRLPQIEDWGGGGGGGGRLCLAGCHVDAKTQSYHLVYIWGSLVKFQRVRLF